MAKANGTSFSIDLESTVGEDATPFSPSGPLLVSGPNGEIGMNTSNVIYILERFITGCKKLIELLGELPTDLVVYDYTNQLQDLFRSKIQYAIESITIDYENAQESITDRVKSEVNNTKIGVNRAAAELSSNG